MKRIENQFGACRGDSSGLQRRVTVTEETLNLIGLVRSSEQGLVADSDVINFLLSLYFMKYSDGKEKPWPYCHKCNSALTLICRSCDNKTQTPTQRTLSQTSYQPVPVVSAPPVPKPTVKKKKLVTNDCPLKDKCQCCCKKNKCKPVKPAAKKNNVVKKENKVLGFEMPALTGLPTACGSKQCTSTFQPSSCEDNNGSSHSSSSSSLSSSSPDGSDNDDTDVSFSFGDVSLMNDDDSEKKFPCDSCNKRFSQAAYLTRHKWKYHSSKECKQCKICQLECSTVKGLRKHVITHKKEITNLCIHCCQAFGTGQELKEHCVVCTSRPLHACDVCDKVFTQKYFLDEHMSKHTGHTPYVCEFCSQRFGSSNGLSRHRSVHTGKTQCNVCGKVFSHLSGLKAHKVIHTGQRPHACAACGKTFTQESNLKTHMMTHTGQKPHCCDQCPKAFAQAISLRRHKLIHTGEKSHICHLCGTSFARSSTLHAHMLTHTGQKKHVCNVCNKGFTQAVALRMHMSTHTGVTENVCNVCGKSFAWPKSLKNHLLSRHGIGGEEMDQPAPQPPPQLPQPPVPIPQHQPHPHPSHPLENMSRLMPMRSESMDSHLAFLQHVAPAVPMPWAT